MLFIIFGYPGVGKTFVGKILEESFGFYLYHADEDVPAKMKIALAKKEKITEMMRDEFFQAILHHMDSLVHEHKNIAISQTFIKEKYRKWILEKFPDVKFVYITALNNVREMRLKERADLDLDYARQMVENFDEPKIPHISVNNSADGKESIKKQLEKIIKDNQ